jgi:hypothetical protein
MIAIEIDAQAAAVLLVLALQDIRNLDNISSGLVQEPQASMFQMLKMLPRCLLPCLAGHPQPGQHQL